jgi:dTMP kinase
MNYDFLKGKAISFEGGEGCGKSTVIKKVAEFLNNQGLDVENTREPGGTQISEQIRNVLLDKENTAMIGETECLLLAASRAQLLKEKILPMLEDGKVVIYDRFVDSSIVYQGGCRGLGMDKVYEINLFATKGFLPYKTFLLDLDPQIGLARIKNNNRDTNRLDEEALDFHYNVRKHYLELAKMHPERIVVINADQTPEEIFEDIIKNLI